MKKIIDELFTLHHSDGGLDEEEINDLIKESTLDEREVWLKKTGYEWNFDD